MNNRAATEAQCIKRMKQLDPSGKHEALYTDFFKNMSNEEFHDFMVKLQKKDSQLSVAIPNYDTELDITTDNNVKLASEMGYEFYQRIWIKDPSTGVEILTPLKHMVYSSNICRQVQSLDHKISVPMRNDQIDELTGQVRGDSRASQVSGPEFMILNSHGLKSTVTELIKFRGGDQISNRIMNNELVKTGGVSMNAIPGATQRSRRSVKTLSIILNSMLFSNNFAG